MAETSDRVSSIAARYRKIELADLAAAVANPRVGGRMVAEIRSMAASLHRQDETKGLRGKLRKIRKAVGL